jgi:hypothetical protein
LKWKSSGKTEKMKFLKRQCEQQMFALAFLYAKLSFEKSA